MANFLSKTRTFLKQTRRSKPLPAVILYTRQSCHLCDDAKDVLKNLQSEEPFLLQVIDVDTDPKLRAEFNDDVPVIYINGRKAFKHRIDDRKFLKSLRAG